MPLATSYAVTEALGFESGVDRSFAEAPFFFTLVAAVIVIGAGIVLLAPGSLVQIMLLAQDVNGILLPIILVFVLLLARRQDVMGTHRTGGVYSAIGWVTAIGLIALTTLLLLTSVPDPDSVFWVRVARSNARSGPPAPFRGSGR